MYRPTNFDASRSYPVVNYLYPGPQSGSVRTRSFRAARRDKQAMAELGFVVVAREVRQHLAGLRLDHTRDVDVGDSCAAVFQ